MVVREGFRRHPFTHSSSRTDVNTSFTGPADSESVSIAVVTAVASHLDVSPTELPPLYEWIDPDAVDALFEPTRSSGLRRGRLEFPYDGHEIVLECDDSLVITVDGVSIVDDCCPTVAESADV